jgi:hypothetical protein
LELFSATSHGELRFRRFSLAYVFFFPSFWRLSRRQAGHEQKPYVKSKASHFIVNWGCSFLNQQKGGFMKMQVAKLSFTGQHIFVGL